MDYGSGQSTSNNNFLIRVGLYAGIGWSLKLRGQKLAKVAILAPVAERAFGITLEQVLDEWLRQRQEKERQERVRQLFQDWAASIKQLPVQLNKKTEAITALSALDPLLGDKDSRWLKIIVHPSVVLVLGKRGSGKSGLGYRLLELFRYRLTPYVLGIPVKAQKLLPDWIGVAQNLDEIPQNSIVLIDEAYLSYHSRDSLKIQSREMSQIVNLSRQRNQTLIFVTQEARQIDKNIASQANVIIFKEPAILQLKFDRPELNDIAIRAKSAFSNLSGDKRRWAYAYSPDADFMDLLENALPTFWSAKLSHAFATGEPVSDGRLPNKMTKEEEKAKAKELQHSGLSYREIGKRLDINEGTAYNYVNDYPYRKKPS